MQLTIIQFHVQPNIHRKESRLVSRRRGGEKWGILHVLTLFPKWGHLWFYSRNYSFSPLQFHLIEWRSSGWMAEIVFREWPGGAVTCSEWAHRKAFLLEISFISSCLSRTDGRSESLASAACPESLAGPLPSGWENLHLWPICCQPMGLVGFVSEPGGPALASYSAMTRFPSETNSPAACRPSLVPHHGESVQAFTS